MEYIKLTWDDIEEQCNILAREIKEKGVPFDVIIGISRGGWVPARLLSDILDNDEVDTLRVKFYKSVGETAKRPEILFSTQIDLEGKDVLLVDDIADTGESLIATVVHLRMKNVRSIFVATLVKKPQSRFIPDLFVADISEWVIFPWELYETARNIKAAGNSEEELRKAGLQE
ncbi:phosphoribosyltransferase [archaeon]|nr:phosphoribosyltransferase [archaeon]